VRERIDGTSIVVKDFAGSVECRYDTEPSTTVLTSGRDEKNRKTCIDQ